MTIAAGTRLGPYEILEPIGAGGMGEVYRARDTRLERTVAIKVLPSHLSASPEVRQRFEREAKTISQLSHPHICALYDVGREGDTEYLVLEYIEGRTLADRLARGPLSLDEALRLGSDLAEALDAAHRLGIVHRDFKPGNVMVTKSGAKVLDFGLAKLREEEMQAAGSRLSVLATRDAPLTAEGTILGTVPYMAPEQLEGTRTDARTDIFAFGATLYEMVTGKKAFSGASQASLMSAILATDPPSVSTSQAMSPATLDRLVKTCLAKDPENRWQSARDIALQLTAITERAETARVRPESLPRRLAPWAIAASVLFLGIVLLLRERAPQVPSASPIRFSIAPPPGTEFANWRQAPTLRLSPDAQRLAFVAYESDGSSRAWVRALSSLDARPIEGTEGANSLFWSPDGASIAFFAQERLARVTISGGSPVTICEVGGGLGHSGSWGAGGEILFANVQGDGIYRVSADGGKAESIIRPDPARGVLRVHWPSFLPDGRSFLYLTWSAASSKGADGALMLSRPGQPPREITPLRSRAEILEPGYLIFARDGALFGQRFDPDSAKLTGPPLPIAPSVNYFLSNGWANFTARAGTLAYHSQEDVLRLTWFDRAGKALGSLGGPGRYLDVAIAPDGKRLLFSRARPGIWTFDIWMFDLARGVETPVTSESGSEFGGLWLPDGKSIIYSVARGRSPQLVSRMLAGGAEREVLPPGGFQIATAVTPDGRLLAFAESVPGAPFDAWTVPLTGGTRPARFSASAPADSVRFSPDGRAAAFLLSESGRREAYVSPFGSPGEKIRVSTDGATLLRFSRDGKELFYLSPDGRFFSVPIRTAPSVEPGEPRVLFRLAPGPGWKDFDVAPDGRFLAMVEDVSSSAQPATVVVNWTAELPKR